MQFKNYNLLINLLLINYVNTQLFKGDSCNSSNENEHKCILLSDCPSAIIALQVGQYPNTCGFEGKLPLVCCSTGEQVKESISDKQCMIYSNLKPTFEIFAIVGGTNAQPQEFPHMAALGYNSDNNSITWQCGGSLVSEKFILTAAHCLNSPVFGMVQWIRLGDNTLPSIPSPPSIYDHKVGRRIPHPQYRPPSVYNDIALIELEKAVPFSSFVRPACLYNHKIIPPNLELIATGWGLTQFAGNRSRILQKVRLELFSDQECKEVYANLVGSRRLRQGIITEEQFCAGSRTSNKDTCQGDSGGPLQTYNRTMRYYSIVGVTSFGKACGLANVPGVYDRVSYYVPWLEKIIWPNEL